MATKAQLFSTKLASRETADSSRLGLRSSLRRRIRGTKKYKLYNQEFSLFFEAHNVFDKKNLRGLGAYGAERIKTPCLDQLARESVVFDNAFADGLPTIPCRRCYQTGKSVVPGAACTKVRIRWISRPSASRASK